MICDLMKTQTWPPHFAKIASTVICMFYLGHFVNATRWLTGGKAKYSRLRLLSPSLFPVYRINGSYRDFGYGLRNVLTSKVAVYLGEAIHSGYCSFDRE